MCKENKAAKLIKFIKENYCEENESSFWAGLNILKGHNKLKEVECDSVNELMDMLSIIKDGGTRAMLIEVIAKIPALDFNSNQKLLDEYIQLIIERDTSNEEAAQCLSDFISLGANKDEIFNIIAKNLDKESAIKILLNIDVGLDYWKGISKESEEFFEDFQKAKRIRDRSGVITEFLSIVHPQVIKYWSVTTFFNYYLDKKTALNFEWNKPNIFKKLMESKVISIKEAEILQRLGKFINNQIEVDESISKKLYDEFFEDNDPLDIIFILPE